MEKNKIIVKGKNISILELDGEKYLSLTDMAREFGEANVLIASWIKRKDTLEYLAIWEKLHNQDFKPHEFEGFKNQAGTNRFNLSPKQWTEKTNAIGMFSKSGRYGGTFAHEDIAIYFGQWLSPEFSLYVVKEFKRFKKLEAQKDSQEWQLNRALSKINYRIHTDSVDQYLIPKHIDKNQIGFKVENEGGEIWCHLSENLLIEDYETDYLGKWVEIEGLITYDNEKTKHIEISHIKKINAPLSEAKQVSFLK